MYRLTYENGALLREGAAGDVLDLLIRHDVRLTTLGGRGLKVVLA